MLERYKCLNQTKILPDVSNIVSIVSGKGGVGKSTVAFNIATSLQRMGLKVGLADADIYGPSLSHLTKIDQKASARHDKFFEPHIYQGMPLISIAHLVEKKQALAWRGPMASGALMQLITQTAWPKLDILIVDMPPGTGDLHLTVAQKLPLTAVTFVTTDHPLALDDYRRSRDLYEKLQVTSLGTILNHIHPCSLQEDIACCQPILATIPCSSDIYLSTAQGKPLESGQVGFTEFEDAARSFSTTLKSLELFQQIPFSLK